MNQLFRNTLLLFAVLSLAGCSNIVRVRLDSSVKDYTPVVCEILKAHPQGDVTLKFDKGTYDFYPEEAPQEFLSLSNNCSGERKVSFLMKGMKDVKVVGNGAEFMFHGRIVPFALMDSENVELCGFSVDYDYPWTFEGEVLSNDPVARSFTVRVLSDQKYRIEGDRLFFGGYDWEYPMGESISFDPATRRPCYDTGAYDHGYWSGEMGAREIGDGIVEFTRLSARDVPPVGSIWDDKGPTSLNRSYPGIAILSSKNVNVNDVHVYRCGAMALLAEYCENVSVKGFSTVQHEGSPRMITSSADATHFVDCKGQVVLENCQFESMLDDATNIHGVYMKVDSVLSTNSFTATFGHWQQEGNHFADAGDQLRFVDKTSLQPVAEVKLTGIDKSDRSRYVMTVDGDLSAIASQPDRYAVENATRVANVIIRNCTVQHNRARSLLISTAGDVLIENCDFASQMAGIRICGDANYWFESGNTRNVVIRGNTFTDLAIGGREPQAILQIDPIIPKDARTNDFFYHDSIVFEDNVISTFDRQVIYALSVKSLSIKNNTFIDTKSYAPLFPELSVIDIQYCGDVDIVGNDFSRWQKDATISIHNCVEVENDSPIEVVDSPNPYFFQS
jgi:hypothetical protein